MPFLYYAHFRRNQTPRAPSPPPPPPPMPVYPFESTLNNSNSPLPPPPPPSALTSPSFSAKQPAKYHYNQQQQWQHHPRTVSSSSSRNPTAYNPKQKRSSSLIESLTARLNLNRIVSADQSAQNDEANALGSIFKNPLQISKKPTATQQHKTANKKDQTDSRTPPTQVYSTNLPPSSPTPAPKPYKHPNTTHKTNNVSPSLKSLSPEASTQIKATQPHQKKSQWTKANFSSLYGLDNDDEPSPNAPPPPPPPLPQLPAVTSANQTTKNFKNSKNCQKNEIFPNLSNVEYTFPGDEKEPTEETDETNQASLPLPPPGDFSDPFYDHSCVKPSKLDQSLLNKSYSHIKSTHKPHAPSAPPLVLVEAHSHAYSASSSITTVVPSNYRVPYVKPHDLTATTVSHNNSATTRYIITIIGIYTNDLQKIA